MSSENKTIRILGHNIEYRYFYGFDGEMDESDIEHIKEMIAEGMVGGELCTSDPNPDSDEDHYGWWEISKN